VDGRRENGRVNRRRIAWLAAAAALLLVLAAAAQAQAVVSATGAISRGSGNTLQLVVRNTGNETIDLLHLSLRSGTRIAAANPNRGSCDVIQVITPRDSIGCDGFRVGQGGQLRISLRTSARYPDGGGGTLLVYSGGGANSSEPVPVIGPSATEGGQPQVGRTELVEVVSGLVRVRKRGTKRFVRLRAGRLLPDRSEIDTRRGTAQITVAGDPGAGNQTALVSEGRAIIDQNRRARPTTTLIMSQPLSCGSRAASAARRKRRARIFVKTNGGRIKTSGNWASGTASGTAWRTIDSCKTTTVTVTEGTVSVFDKVLRKRVRVTAPDSYTAHIGRSPGVRTPGR
jgi:hypothetical protein